MSKRKIRILFVDDDRAFLRSLQEDIELNEEYSEHIEPLCFGSDAGEVRNSDYGQSFYDYIKEQHQSYIADIIVCDYDLGSDIRAIEILELAQKYPSLPPIVIMTANGENLQKEGIESVRLGAKGYIIKSNEALSVSKARDYFMQDLLVTAMRLHTEQRQLTTHKIITEVNHKRDNNVGDIGQLAKHYIEVFAKYYPYYTVVIREYQAGVMKLIASNIEDESIREALSELRVGDVKLLNDLLSSDSGVISDVAMKTFVDDDSVASSIRDAAKSLNIESGLMIRVGDKNTPLGNISIYCHNRSHSFDDELKGLFRLSANSIRRDWQLMNRNRRYKDLIDFVKKILEAENEDEIWEELGALIHRHYNQESENTKTTIKILDPLTNLLVYKATVGIDCKNTEPIPIYNSNISCWVFRNNHFCVLNRDAFEDPRAEEKSLKRSFVEALTKNRGDENIDFFTNNSKMLSELCLPIVSEGRAIGVLNLESNQPYAYGMRKTPENIQLRKEIEYLVTVAEKRVSNLRHENFMRSMIQAISKESHEERLKQATKFLEEFVGFGNFGIVLLDKNRLKMEYFTYNSSNEPVGKEDMRSIEEKLNKDGSIKNFIEAEEVEEKTRYIPDIARESHFIIIEGSNTKSAFISKLSFAGEVLGAVNIGFDRENPLSENQLKILEGFVAWLGRDIREHIDNEKLKEKVDYLTSKNTLDALFRNLSHAMGTPLNTAKANLEAIRDFRDSYSADEIEKIVDETVDLLITVSNYPKRYISSATYGYKTLERLYGALIDDLRYKIDSVEVELHYHIEPVTIKAEHTSYLYMILFHPLLNALEAEEVTEIGVKASVDRKKRVCTITIEDDGKGFVETDFAKLKTTKSDGGGFGLKYIHQMIEFELKGEMKLENRESGGAQVVITLPLSEKEGEYEL